MTRSGSMVRRRIATIGAIGVALLALGVWGYRRVERARQPAASVDAVALPAAPAPSLVALQADGTARELAGRGRVRLVHFWATWCGPCRKELPELLQRARQVDGLELLAIAVDDAWPDIAAFFPDGTPPEVLLARDRGAEARYGTQGLPDSYVVAADGRLVERIVGPRDWSTPSARAYLRALPARWR